ncbi:MAG: LPS export ABC transporter periplasmic protein LptC [Acidobacteria bacterium]|nr:LPS export ABC transporter periplasmic protein LptC [Acidobacteriota bacterium]
MRRLRPLLLLALVAVTLFVGGAYYVRRQMQARGNQPAPTPLSGDLTAAASNWKWSHSAGGKPVADIEARDFRQLTDPPRFELTDVQLKIYREDGRTFHRVRSPTAHFSAQDGLMYADGEVEIKMAEPAADPQPDDAPRTGRLVTIQTSGVQFEIRTGKATTSRPARFTFDEGSGEAMGASWDPQTEELRLLSAARLHYKGRKGKGKPMDIEAGEAVYYQQQGKVFLNPWAKMRRGTLTMEAGQSNVQLAEGSIDQVDAQNARGIDHQPKRDVEYAADQLSLKFTGEGEIGSIAGIGNARLISKSPEALTTVTSRQVDLAFQTPPGGESWLEKAVANGAARVESKPVARAGVVPPETRVLTSEAIELKMRPGGEEIGSVETHAPGRADFLPSVPIQRKRHLAGERIWMTYAAGNRLETLHSVNASTRTEPAAAAPPRASKFPVLTTSRDLTARFDPKTGQLARLEQTEDFRYEEGPRQARAANAVLDQAKEEITLAGASRVWDPTGATEAERIVLDQKNGGFAAFGKVRTTRQPDGKPGAGGGVVSAEEAMRARADTMTARDSNSRIRYEGNAVLWQGASRLEAHQVDIDRGTEQLTARGGVVSLVADAPQPGRAPGFTTVRAPEMTYAGKDRMIRYTGGATLLREGIDVQAREIRAYLAEENTEVNNELPSQSIEKAFADGAVEIVETRAGRERRGSSEHAEYYLTEGRVLLDGGSPEFHDPQRGVTRGRQLTWFANNDRLLVDGVENRPAVSTLIRKSASKSGARK